MNMYPLYIDPGTGSILFSVLIGAAATLYFVLRALIIKLKVTLSGRSNVSSSVSCPYVIYNEGKQYCNVFKPILDEFEKKQIQLRYLTSAKDDPICDLNYQYIKCEFIGEGNRAFAYLNLLSADILLMTTPGLNVYQLKRSKMVKHYSHILHAPGDATMYRLFGIDYFDSILLTGDYQANDIRILETMRNLPQKQLITIGCTYLDIAKNRINTLSKEENHQFTVLVSPSWGPSALLSRYGTKLLDPLIKTGWRIIVRPHPQSKKSENSMLENIKSQYIDNANLEWDFESDNIYSLSKSDIMISDFSGVIFDYMFLFNKPVIYVKQGFDLRPYDADDLGENAAENLWQFRTLLETGIELNEDNFTSIKEIIQKASDSTELETARQKSKETAWMFQGDAGKLAADFMINTVKNA